MQILQIELQLNFEGIKKISKNWNNFWIVILKKMKSY